MASAIKRYAFINAKLRTRLSNVLKEDFYDSLIRAHSIVDAMQLLKNTSFSVIESTYSQTGDLKMAELELFREEVLLFKNVEHRVDGIVKDFCWALSTYYEIENVKRIVRLWFDRAIRGRNIEDSLGYLYRDIIHHDLKIDYLLGVKDFSGVSEVLANTPYEKSFEETLPAVRATNSLFAFEIALDKFYYRELLAVIKKLNQRDNRIAKKLIGVEIDMLNINWVIRFKTLYNLPLGEALKYALPSGYKVDAGDIARAYEEDGLTDIFASMIRKHDGFADKIKEQGGESTSRLILIEHILEFVIRQEVGKVLVGYPFTIGIILAYFILKKIEIQKIMMIMNAKLYGIKPEEIKSRL
jgi:V/A-type H+-transporting ATPase subunit C